MGIGRPVGCTGSWQIDPRPAGRRPPRPSVPEHAPSRPPPTARISPDHLGKNTMHHKITPAAVRPRRSGVPRRPAGAPARTEATCRWSTYDARFRIVCERSSKIHSKRPSDLCTSNAVYIRKNTRNRVCIFSQALLLRAITLRLAVSSFDVCGQCFSRRPVTLRGAAAPSGTGSRTRAPGRPSVMQAFQVPRACASN